VHIAAYSHLLDTIGMPELEYQAFMKYKEMSKFDHADSQSTGVRDRQDARRVRRITGLQLSGSFAILLISRV
jgi:ribonucleoside-diphosphate reductase beta chain